VVDGSGPATTSPIGGLKRWLAHPLTRDVALDEPLSTARHRAIIEAKPFLKRLYAEWYERICALVPQGDQPMLEVGSGAGFLGAHIPRLVTSDLVPAHGVRLVLDARQLPFAAGTLRAILMVNVFHHISQPRAFLTEAARVVSVGGALIMLEPWLSRWSRFVYGNFHEEPFDPVVEQWEFPEGGRLTSANGALPWIVFQRDRARFEREFPQWKVEVVDLSVGGPFRYLLSGGVSLIGLTPAASFGAWRLVERALTPFMSHWAMFAIIRLTRVRP
jgi:SAM-dependent methyltransferase